MTKRILCVDDDSNILAGFERKLRKRFSVDTALGSLEGLDRLEKHGPYAVVVADMQMPTMDGVEFLARVKQKYPDTVRMMLTGQADLQVAMNAVNEGNIFRFLTKPCATETLVNALDAGLYHHRLITAERELLQKTLRGAINVLTEILSTVDPQSFGKATLLRDLSRTFTTRVGTDKSWAIEVAATLSQIGLVTIPPDVVAESRSETTLSEIKNDMLTRVPELSHNLIANIPRLETVSEIVLYQDKHFDGTGFPRDTVAGKEIPEGARILKILSDLLTTETEHNSRSTALTIMQSRRGWYDPVILNLAIEFFGTEETTESAKIRSKAISVVEMEPGQFLLSDVTTTGGLLLLASGHQVTATSVLRIQNIAKLSGIREPILVEDSELIDDLEALEVD